MLARVRITAIVGPLTGQQHVYEEPGKIVLGRDLTCDIVLPDDAEHSKVSRRHCEINLDPPEALLRDLASRNGTRVNERVISQRARTLPGEMPGECNLGDGDEIHLGGTVLRIAIETPAICDRCQKDVPDDQREAWRVGDGVYLCPRCRRPADPAPSRPLTIPGHTILRQLGQGGMGAVHLAREDATGREVALKVMLPVAAANAKARALFLREVRALRVLQHPNIVALLDSGEVSGQLYFTMEYCAGGTVRDLLKAGGALAPADALPLILQVLDGLEYAHNLRLPGREEAGGTGPRGVIHRDLSPDNLFLVGTGTDRTCKVGDYGLARVFEFSGLSGVTRTGTVGGKACYICRQQVLNYKDARPELDVWGAAACLYTMLAGTTPRDFLGKRGDDWGIVLNTDPIPIRQRRPDLPDRLADVIDRALADHATLAFASATAFRAALLAALS
jgi:pSer/pThr/pTyr-binding forkhead associated (FHA) protein